MKTVLMGNLKEINVSGSLEEYGRVIWKLITQEQVVKTLW